MQLSLAEANKKKKAPSLRLEPKEAPSVVVVDDDDDDDGQKIPFEAVLIGAGPSEDLPRPSTGVVSTVTIDAGDESHVLVESQPDSKSDTPVAVSAAPPKKEKEKEKPLK